MKEGEGGRIVPEKLVVWGECFEEQGNVTLKGALALFFQFYRIKRKTGNGVVEWVARGVGSSGGGCGRHRRRFW